MHNTFTDILRRLGLWSLVCGISATPSFIWAVSEFDPYAMVTGVGIFVLALTAITCTRTFLRFSRTPFVRRTLYIGYGMRLGVSVLFPIGMFLDLWPGLLSVGLIDAAGVDQGSFIGTLLITLVQGTILNVILAIVMSLIYGFQWLVCKRPQPSYACEQCGYDLRGSAASPRCPECGILVAQMKLPAAA